MSITISCPITGAAFRLPSFGTHQHTITSPHPLLGASVSQLAAIEVPESHADCHILLCAWLDKLSRLGICQWNGILSPLAFSLRWHEQQMPALITTAIHCITNSNHPALSIIPRFSLSAELTSENLQTWRESVDSIFSSYSTYHDIAESKRLREAQEAATLILDSMSAEDLEATIAVRRARSRKLYVSNCLAFHENQEGVALVTKVIARPFDYELVTLQSVKTFCLEYLNEKGHENYNDKQEIIQMLDAAILDRVGMVQLLGCATDSQLLDASSIRAKYQHTVDGNVYVTSVNPKVTAAINAQNQAAVTSSESLAIMREPMRSEYKHGLAYEAARRIWIRTTTVTTTTEYNQDQQSIQSVTESIERIELIQSIQSIQSNLE